MIATLLSPLRLALRNAWRAPVFAVLTVALTALAAAANGALFGSAWLLLGKPLPYRAPEELVRLEINLARFNMTMGGSVGIWRALRENRSVFAAVEGWHADTAKPDRDGHAWSFSRVTPGLLPELGITPIAGRSFAAGDDEHAVLLSAAMATRRYGSPAAALGQTLEIASERLTVIGVLGDGVVFPSPRTELWRRYSDGELARPLDGNVGNFDLLGRLQPGATPEAAEAAMAQVFTAPEFTGLSAAAGLRGKVGPLRTLWQNAALLGALPGLLAAAALLALAIAANLVNLVIERALRRRAEWSVRQALGAGSARLARQWLAELGVLGTLGLGLGGLLLLPAGELLRAFGLLSRDLPFALSSEPMAWLAMAVVVAAMLLGGAIAGAALIARQTLRPGANAGLQRGAVGGRQRLSSAATMVQVGLATLITASAILLWRGSEALLAQDLGFDPRGLVVANIDFGDAAAPTEDPLVRARRARDLVTAVPGVRLASYTQMAPYTGSESVTTVLNSAGDGELQARTRAIGPDFFAALGAPLIAGRALVETDRDAEPGPLVVDTLFVRQVLGIDGDPAAAVGRSFTLSRGKDSSDGKPGRDVHATVVGVVPAQREQRPDKLPEIGGFYHPANPVDLHGVVLLVRGDLDAGVLAGRIDATLRQAFPAVREIQVNAMSTQVADSVRAELRLTSLAGGLAATLLGLALVGLAAVLGYRANRRTRELGLRQALGATPTDNLRLMLREGLALGAVGLALGLAAAIVVVPRLSPWLYTVSVFDPLSWALTLAVLLLAIGTATLVPARRAAAVTACEALRDE
jgi:predicted permease